MENNMEKTILQFKSEIKNFTLDELKEKRQQVQDSISKMILESDLVLKAAILDAAIAEKEKTDGETK